MDLKLYLFGNVFLSIIQIYAWHNISNNKFKLNIKNIIKIVILSSLIVLIYYFINNYIKGILIFILAIIFCINILKIKLKDAILLTFIGQLLIIIFESLIVLSIKIIFGFDTNYIASSPEIVFIVNALVGLSTLFASKIKVFNKIYVKILKITNNIKANQVLIFVFFVTFGSGIFATSVYFDGNFIIKFAMNSIVSLIYTVIIILVFNYQQKYYKINSKYKMSLEDLQAQEKLINDYRIMNHENRNQLSTIKAMTKNKKIIGYIDSLIKSKNRFDNNIIKDSLKLPKGGIRGLLYNKMLLMKENDIKYYLNADSKINHKIMSNIENDDIVDICNILGVFLDNAIEECNNIKDKMINMSFYIDDNKLIIIISNNYLFKYSKYKNSGILKTTKEKGRGYGLQLVKNIIDQNNKLYNERQITKDTFSQKLIIKL